MKAEQAWQAALGLPDVSLGSVFGSIGFGGPAALPVIKGYSIPSDISRTNSNLYAYQKYNYSGGIFMDAIVASGTPDAVTTTGPANVIGRKFNDHAAVEDEYPKVLRIAVRGLTEATRGNALGIGIDYAIHFLNMSRIKGREEEGVRQALEATASTAGRAIIYNAAAVGLGFLTLVLCSFIPQIYFGAFITLTMITASMATLTLLPCLIYSFRPGLLEKEAKGEISL